LRPLSDFREEDLDGAEPWCASCREIAEELARDEEEEAGR
jgi:thiol-disulfide isomerase/thioredoxin